MSRWAWIEVDLGAVAHNVRHLVEVVAPAGVWAVVKADGYGHGAVAIARTALDAGATGLAVALVQEGVALRAAGITAPILVLSAQPRDQLPTAIGCGLELTVYRAAHVEDLEDAGGVDVPVHVKVDTGMHRVGAPPSDAASVVAAVAKSPATRLAGIFTHLAVADEPADPYNAAQLDAFERVLADLRRGGGEPPVVHAANSAAALTVPRARYDVVRAGIAVYGIVPGPGVAAESAALRPALSLHARVSHVARLAAGERLSYGLRHRLTRDATVATVPIGYADGVPRRMHAVGGEVLIRGSRRPIVGVVTMDQLLVDCDDTDVDVGDEVTLIGTQGDETITANDWGERLGTIGYEIVCALSPRLERRYTGG